MTVGSESILQFHPAEEEGPKNGKSGGKGGFSPSRDGRKVWV